MRTFSPANSSNVHNVSYDPATKTLYVTFKAGGRYAYDGVPEEEFNRIQSADSVGSHIHAHVKGRYTARRLDKPHMMEHWQGSK